MADVLYKLSNISKTFPGVKALQDISFDVRKGEAVGLIGVNGCGKSTTLKLLSRIMYPDSGKVEMNGRVSALIELGAGFVPARKPGKLPRETASQEFDLEYGTATLQVHLDSLSPGDKVLIVDDLVATGGTMVAQIKLAEQLGAELVGIAGLMELEFLNPRAILAEATDCQLHSLVKVS